MKTKSFAESSLVVAVIGLNLLAGGLPGAAAQESSPSKVKVAPTISMKAFPFDLKEVRLLDGPFKRAMELDRQYLLSLDVDRLLHNFRVNAGLPSSASPLGGWEEPKCEVRGHFVGHYLSACALMYASTGDARLKEKGSRIVAGLAECQAKIGSGYLSAYPEEFFDRVEKLQRVWAPYYTLHKIYAGLLDMYVYCDNRPALAVCRKFADWVISRNARLTDEQMQQMLGNEHGGMNETLANLYGLTGDEMYLQIARRFNHQPVIGPASRREDKLTDLHANTQIPKFVGTARQYELTGEDSLKTASTFFWDTVVKERSYVIGGHSDGEHFSPKETLSQALGPSTTETCNTYNMLKLTRHLFCWNPQAEYADYYERALYNHILSSQNPETGGLCYYVPLRSGSRKTYGGPLDAFWCCTGTGIENHAKYGDSIYFHDGGKTLFVNLFIASELNWQAHGLKLRQEAKYPDEGGSRLVFTCEKPIELSLNVRHPSWAATGFELRVNGEKQARDSKPGSYAVVRRTWKSGDTIDISMPFMLRTEGFRDNPRRFAFMHGPLVLAAEVDLKKPFPAVVAEEEQLLASLKPMAGKPSTFAGASGIFRIAGEPDGRGVRLEPFYKMHGNRPYVVYWDAFTPAQWQAKEAEYKIELARQKELESRTVDRVNPGEEQNERDHGLKGEQTGAGDFSDRKWRHATDGGWFSWELKVQPEQPQELRVTYWGSDGGNRVFDILIDGAKLAAQRLQQNKPGQFYDEVYPISPEMIKDKEKVTVRFQAARGAWAGGVFGCAVLKRQQ
ncbi:MAG: glycoside hydrolase family 127 protein [Chloroflexi bacterium]|nr:glycoside hydrolase family 127 protein [Chloroflexota bacterium]